MTTQATESRLHVFEKAGLGKAPFRCVGVSRKVGPLLISEKDGVRYECGAPGQPMGVCDFCGTGIADCFEIRSADGKEFVVGCDCVRRTGDAGLIRNINPIVRKMQRDARHANEARKIEELKSLIATPEVAAKLASIPSPTRPTRETGAQYVEWMMRNAGTTGKLVVLRWIKNGFSFKRADRE